MSLSAEERNLLTEVRDLLREALPVLRGEVDNSVSTDIVHILSMDDPVQALRERNKAIRLRDRNKGMAV